MTEDSTFTLDLSSSQIHGTEIIKISKIIKQQIMKIIGYSVTCTSQNNLNGAVYIEAQELTNVDYLMDTNPNKNTLLLKTNDDLSQTFVSNCNKVFKMSGDLDHNFYINCYYKNNSGNFIKIDSSNFFDIKIIIEFNLQTLE